MEQDGVAVHFALVQNPDARALKQYGCSIAESQVMKRLLTTVHKTGDGNAQQDADVAEKPHQQEASGAVNTTSSRLSESGLREENPAREVIA